MSRGLVALCLALALAGPALAAKLEQGLQLSAPPQPNLLPMPQALPPATTSVPPPEPRSASADAAAYAHCMKLAATDPKAAESYAESWQARGGAHPAMHCAAVALIGLKHYKEGATRLEELAKAMVHAPPELRAEVLDQAAQAWLLDGNAVHAYATEGEALRLHPNDASLLLDRAEAAGEAGFFERAVADLDRVLKQDPKRVTALVYRASAYRRLNRLGPALADIQEALRLDPKSVPALLERGNILRLKGDIDGARRDWLRVGELAPHGAANAAARLNLERLELSEEGQAASKRGRN